MKTVFLWLFTASLFLQAIFAVPVSIVASIFFLAASLFLCPFVRSKYLSKYSPNFFLKWYGSALVIVGFLYIANVMLSKGFDADNLNRVLNDYQQGPTAFTQKIKNDISEKYFFSSKDDLELLIKKYPKDELLKVLRHDVEVGELRHNAAENKLSLYTLEKYSAYKSIVGISSKLEEFETIYLELTRQAVSKSLEEGKFSEARAQMDNLIKIYPYYKDISGQLEKIIADAESKKAVQGKSSQASTQNSTGSSRAMSRVIGKINSLIFLANGQTFGIDSPTMLHIDGQMYPKGSASPDYIQEGYSCRFTGNEGQLYAAEVFCTR